MESTLTILKDVSSDIEINKEFDKYLNESRRYREQFESDWEKQERFYKGDQWEFGKQRPVKNWCFTIVEAELPILTDSRPGTSIIPMDERADQDAKMLESAIEYIYDSENLQFTLPQAVKESLITGSGWLYVDFDPDREVGEGAITIEALPWRWIFIDPSASDIKKAGYIIIRRPVNVNDLKRRYPKFADEIVPMKESEMDSGKAFKDFRDPLRNTGHLSNTQEVSRFDTEENSVLEELWVRDYSLVTIPEEETELEILREHNEIMQGIHPDIGKFENHEAHMDSHRGLRKQIASLALSLPIEEVTDADIENLYQDPEYGLILKVLDDHLDAHELMKIQNPKSKKPKFKNNMRLIQRVGSVIIYDGETPTLYDGVPLVPFYAYKDINSVYADSEIKQIISAQENFNEIDYSEKQGLLLLGNSGWILDEDAGVDENTLTNAQGLVVKKKRGTEVSRMQPGQVSPQFQQRKAEEKSAIETISGINEQTQGKTPNNVIAQNAIRYLRDQAIGRIRLKSRMIEEYSMPLLGKVVAAYILRFWTVERKLRSYDDSGRIKTVSFDPDKLKDLNYEVRVSPGTTSGLDKQAMYEFYKDLLLKGAIDQKMFFTLVDIPNKSKVMDMLEERDQTQAVIQQLTAQVQQLEAIVSQTPPSQEELNAINGNPTMGNPSA